MRAIVLTAILLAPVAASAQVPSLVPIADRIFARWASPSGPGCALGVDAGGQRFTRAYGSAELEFAIPNTPETIFESGSLAKQFTAATVVLLALDGKLGLDDDVRKYVPELPTYERTITIRHLLNHTSGLRDWSDIVGLAGWPRGTRTVQQPHVLELITRQRALNYPPGDRYSYSNSGYNLAATIVERVSGQSFARFSAERLFGPLGLTHTQWRDNYRKLVKQRAQAYTPVDSTWRLDMPFENPQGNCCLLTTVSDLLDWTAMLEHPTPQWKALVDSLHVRARLTSNTTIGYALGIEHDTYRGVERVSHTGATAGYRTALSRFPGRGVSIAVLCNAASAAPWDLANQVADEILASALGPKPTPPTRPATPAVTWAPTAADMADFAGEYYSSDVGVTWKVFVDNGALILTVAPAIRVLLTPLAKDTYNGFAGRVRFARDASGKVVALHSSTSRAYDVTFERAATAVR